MGLLPFPSPTQGTRHPRQTTLPKMTFVAVGPRQYCLMILSFVLVLGCSCSTKSMHTCGCGRFGISPKFFTIFLRRRTLGTASACVPPMRVHFMSGGCKGGGGGRKKFLVTAYSVIFGRQTSRGGGGKFFPYTYIQNFHEMWMFLAKWLVYCIESKHHEVPGGGGDSLLRHTTLFLQATPGKGGGGQIFFPYTYIQNFHEMRMFQAE